MGEDTIYGVDFAERIADALARTDYREAVRLLYLQTLKQLSDGKRIDWQLYKTPTQYIYEVRLPAFRQMTNHFLRVRYGNFEATETLFHAGFAERSGERRGGMKGNHWFIAGIIVFLVLMFAIVCRLPKKFVWNPTFSHYDKQPFGCAVFDSLLSSSLPKGYSLSRKTFYELEQEDTTLRRGILVDTDNLH